MYKKFKFDIWKNQIILDPVFTFSTKQDSSIFA